MNKIIAALSIALVSGLAMADKPAVTVVLSNPDTMTQGMALVLTNQMQEQGAQVDVLLCDKAADIALKGAGGDALKPNGVTPSQLLDAAMKKGASVSVCALYLPNSGRKPDDLKDGIKPAKPAAMAKSLLEPQRKVIGF